MIFIVVRLVLLKMEVVMLTGKKTLNHDYKNKGFTYIGLLAIIVIAGIGLTGVSVVWHQDMQREREKELLFIGEQFRLAIGHYYEDTPSGVKQFPKKLEDLVFDNRFPVVRRHLRKLYLDPIDRNKPWGLVTQQGQIIGVNSLSVQTPTKKSGFEPIYESFKTASEYSDWKFIYSPGTITSNTLINSQPAE